MHRGVLKITQSRARVRGARKASGNNARNRSRVSKARSGRRRATKGDEILQRRNSRCARHYVVAVVVFRGSVTDTRTRACDTHVHPVCARGGRAGGERANLHVNIFRENKSIRMREEELLKLVIARSTKQPPPRLPARRSYAIARRLSRRDKAARKHPVTRYRMSRRVPD